MYDKNYLHGVTHPELAALLPVLYPGPPAVFPNLANGTFPTANLGFMLG